MVAHSSLAKFWTLVYEYADDLSRRPGFKLLPLKARGTPTSVTVVGRLPSLHWSSLTRALKGCTGVKSSNDRPAVHGFTAQNRPDPPVQILKPSTRGFELKSEIRNWLAKFFYGPLRNVHLKSCCSSIISHTHWQWQLWTATVAY